MIYPRALRPRTVGAQMARCVLAIPTADHFQQDRTFHTVLLAQLPGRSLVSQLVATFWDVHNVAAADLEQTATRRNANRSTAAPGPSDAIAAHYRPTCAHDEKLRGYWRREAGRGDLMEVMSPTSTSWQRHDAIVAGLGRMVESAAHLR